MGTNLRLIKGRVLSLDTDERRNSLSKTREMVEVILYEDGHYERNDIDSHYATQRLRGFRNEKSCDIYYCKKNEWKMYLLKLLSTNEIDEQIKELQKKKERINDLRQKIVREINR